MSYILDALKKADAERERGAVPGLRAQPVVGDMPAAAHAPPTRTLLWVGGIVVAVAGLAGSYWLGMGNGAAPAPAAAPTTMARAAPQATVMPQPVPAPPPAVPSAPVAVAAQTTTAKPLATPAPSPKPAALAPVALPVAQPPAAAPAPLLSELPADIRSPIPAITIQGSVYSETPTQRLLLANGQVLGQGATLAPDLTVVEIGKGQSEFSFRGTRFRLAH